METLMAEEIVKNAACRKGQAMAEGFDERSAEKPNEEASGTTLFQALRLEHLRSEKMTDPVTKKLVRRLLTMVSRKAAGTRKKSGINLCRKDASGRNSECSAENTAICEEAEATLGEMLLLRAGAASFATQHAAQRRRIRRTSSVSQMCMRLSCRVLCASASQFMVKDEDDPITLPLTSEGEGSRSQFLMDYYSKASVLAENDIASVRSIETAGSTSNTTFSGEILEAEDFISGESWWQREPARSPMRSAVIAGNNSRMNTIIAESPMLASNSNNNLTQALLQERLVEQHPARVSLMALLRERNEAIGASARYPIANEDGLGSRRRDAGVIGDVVFCCVCMVALKDAAFVPCGHTFCRSCTKELWKARRACPLCNKLIMQILYLF